jgi:hypothetical protein
MQYLLLIYGNEAQWDTKTEADRNAVLKEYGEFTKSIAQSGHLRGGNELNVTSTATTVRVRDKKQLVTDGSFAETKEQLGGYYLIEAKDLDDAIAVAARIPSARWGSIEVRPIIPHDMPSSPAPVHPATLWGVSRMDIERIFREESGRILATLIGLLGSFDLAEEAMQEAFTVALAHWPQRGTPANPRALHDLIRSRYFVAYKPADFQPNGSYRTISVTAEKEGKRLQVRARKGYHARLAATPN